MEADVFGSGLLQNILTLDPLRVVAMSGNQDAALFYAAIIALHLSYSGLLTASTVDRYAPAEDVRLEPEPKAPLPVCHGNECSRLRPESAEIPQSSVLYPGS